LPAWTAEAVGKLIIVSRLVVRDLRYRRGETAMLVIAFVAATATLTLGLILHGVTSHPYRQTRAATAGPDVEATAFPSRGGPPADRAALASLTPLVRARGVTAHTGPYPVAFAVLRAAGHTDAVLAEGRGQAPAAVDQPALTQGSWVRPGGVVLERSFADALGIRAGDRVTLNGRSFLVTGIAVTAAVPTSGVGFLESSPQFPNPGLIWVTHTAAESLATLAHPLGYLLNLKLANPSAAESFANIHTSGGSYRNNVGNPYLLPWQDISQQDGQLIRSEQQIMLVASWLLALLALSSVAVLVGGRMADQIRRVGLLKAVGGTPALVAGVLLAEYVAVALVAAVAGLAAGRLAAPLLTSPGAGLLGTAGAPPLTLGTAGEVVGVAVGVSAAATFIPAIRAARTSTVSALLDAARQPRRRALLIALSARLPVPALLGLRLAARRPRRVAANAITIAVTVSGLVALLFAQASVGVPDLGATGSGGPGQFDVGFASPTERLDQVLLIVTVMLAMLAAVNAIFIAQATVRDARHNSAVTRGIGASCRQVAAGLSAAQVLPALAGALAGIPGGIGLFAAANQGGYSGTPPAWWLIAVVLLTVAGVAGLTAAPVRAGARSSIAEVLQAEVA
jgi:ABC-type antimicrobial peptide transport system permease subunit